MLNIEEAQLKLKDLNQAMAIEKSHRYIDVQGKKRFFSGYMVDTLKELRQWDLADENGIEGLIQKFKKYKFMDIGGRMHALDSVEGFLKKASQNLLGVRKTATVLNPQDAEHHTTHDISQISVQFIKGVGPKLAKLLAHININSVEDLLYYFPKRYLDYHNRLPISALQDGQEVTVMGSIRSVTAFNTPKKPITIVTVEITDGTGKVYANWFYGKSNRAQIENYKARFSKGAEVMLSGKVKWDRFKRSFAIDRGNIEILSYQDATGSEENTESLHAGRIVPVYQLCEGLNLRFLRKAIHQALADYLDLILDPLPIEIQKQHQLIGLKEALNQIHFPETSAHYQQARERLVFDELFYLQVRLALIRQQYKRNQKAFSFHKQADSYSDQLIGNLPFQLTNAQKRVFDEILADMASKEPMYRLIQGDVGSGKTIVAALSMMIALENGYQAALMAPTEILAEQHYRKFIEWLTPLGLKVALFTGKAGAKERRELQQGLLNGQIHMAIGTHALIQDAIEFHKLGVVVIDEQHRFGVRQRTLLKSKGEHPEMLTMTATPIPRTLAMTAHGDLDVSVIDELPPGRTPIKTVLLTSNQHQQAYQLIRYEIQQGRQAYIVFPLIEESETLSAKAATTEAERLQNEVFPDLKIGLLHGKLKSEEKEAVMQAFINKQLDILVSTTVIEVGVDVPNSTVMVIENADRFGLAQLHQLRGRVGRGSAQSYCVLVSDSRGEDTMTRLGIMTQTQDGFLIAEKDLEIRGPGEFLGTRQSGLPDFALADLVQDKPLLEKARQSALDLVASPGGIAHYPDLERMMFHKTEESVGALGSG